MFRLILLHLLYMIQRQDVTLKIQDGCNQFCSYCIIPYARGRERSMEPDLVIAEAKRLCKKIVGNCSNRHSRSTDDMEKEYNITLPDIIRTYTDRNRKCAYSYFIN